MTLMRAIVLHHLLRNLNRRNEHEKVIYREDEDALLMAELARVKKEKELARQKEVEMTDSYHPQAEEKAQMEAALNREEMLHSNPLMFSSEDSTLKRRWDDDVLFLNQGKTEKRKKRFINDTIRNDFHVNFMNSVFK